MFPPNLDFARGIAAKALGKAEIVLLRLGFQFVLLLVIRRHVLALRFANRQRVQGLDVARSLQMVMDLLPCHFRRGRYDVGKGLDGAFDSVGNPIFQYSTAKTFAMPQPFTRVSRIVYVAETDTMYVSGYTSAYPYDGSHWKEAGRVLARYNNWSSGTPPLQYVITLPWALQANPPHFIGAPVCAALHIAGVLRQRADAGNREQRLELFEVPVTVHVDEIDHLVHAGVTPRPSSLPALRRRRR